MKPVLVTFTWCVHMITEPGPLSSLCISRPSPSCFCLSRWIRMWACTGRAVILEPPGGQCCLLQFELQEITDQRGLSGQTRPHLVFCGLHCCTNQRRHPLTQNNNTSQDMKNAFLFDYRSVSLTSLSSCSSSGTSTAPRVILEPARSTFSSSSFWSNLEVSSAWWRWCSHSCRSVPCSTSK